MLPWDPGQREHRREPEGRLAEAVGLAEAIRLEVVGGEIAPLRKIAPATLLGSGKVNEIGAKVEEHEINLVVVDAPLAPVQQRNLEKKWKTKVIDRTGLILEIFGDRARTREGSLQVELAALEYQRSRLVRSWTHLERQRGGFGFVGGPGESQLELDRRLIGERIERIEKDLEDVRRTRTLHRKARDRVPYPVVALVGYTNAGKSTLFNRLTGAEVLAKDQLFATLDPTMRVLRLPGGRKVILSDTVGFISELPTTLVAAFRATLEEVLAADVILHVRDVAHEESAAQRQDVEKVLGELGVDEPDRLRRVLEVWNKVDLLEPGSAASMRTEAARRGDVAVVSAVTGEGLPELATRIEERLGKGQAPIELDVPNEDGELIAWLHRNGEILEREDGERVTHVKVLLDDVRRQRLEARLGRPV